MAGESNPIRTDHLAAEAARLFLAGKAHTVSKAIALACERGHGDAASAPTSGAVREHIQGQLLESLGEAGYAAHVRRRLTCADDVMTVLAAHDDVVDVLLVGRAAAGRFDGELTLHIRVYTDRRIGDIAEDLVTHGYEEPRFATAETRYGRLDRLFLVERGMDVEICITRCPPRILRDAERDLFKDAPIAVMRQEALVRLVRESDR